MTFAWHDVFRLLRARETALVAAATVVIAVVIGPPTLDYLAAHSWLKPAAGGYASYPLLALIVILALAFLIANTARALALMLGEYLGPKLRARRARSHIAHAIEALPAQCKIVLRCFLDASLSTIPHRSLSRYVFGNYEIQLEDALRAMAWLREAHLLIGPALNEASPNDQWDVPREVWVVLWLDPSRVGSEQPPRKAISV